MILPLRRYQSEALAAIEAARGRGVERCIVALPTGTGKTVVFSHWIKKHGGSTLILAHREELLAQAADKLSTVAPELSMSIGFVQAGRNDVLAPIVVGSVPTLARQARLDQLPKQFDTVIVDEAHHATAASYRRILDHVEAEVVIGMTATPERHDEERLSDVFEEIVYARSILEMIGEGYLSNLRGIRVELEDLDLSDVKMSKGDYQQKDLGRAMKRAHAPEETAAAVSRHADDRKIVVFVPTVALAHETAEALVGVGVPAEPIDGEMKKPRRRRVLDWFGGDALQAVVNVGVLTEGYDNPAIDCVAIAAPTKSRIKYVQMVGRGTRIFPGKADCLVMDLCGVSEELELQSLPDLFGLEQPMREGETVTDALEREEAEEEFEADMEAEGDRPGNRPKATRINQRSRDLELFRREGMNWLEVDNRWVLDVGDSTYLVLERVESQYHVLLVWQNVARILARGLDFGYAQGTAEEAVRKRGAMSIAKANEKWRQEAAMPSQIARLKALGGHASFGTSKGEVSDAITALEVGERLERLDKKLTELGELGRESTNTGGGT